LQQQIRRNRLPNVNTAPDVNNNPYIVSNIKNNNGLNLATVNGSDVKSGTGTTQNTNKDPIVSKGSTNNDNKNRSNVTNIVNNTATSVQSTNSVNLSPRPRINREFLGSGKKQKKTHLFYEIDE
jgi:hypothetical protein